MKRFMINWQASVSILLYLFVILYTLTFPSSVSWFIFYAFTFMLLTAFFSAQIKLFIEPLHWYMAENNHLSLSLRIKRRQGLLFLLSSFKLVLYSEQDKAFSQVIYPAVLLRNRIDIHLDELTLSRGRYDQLQVAVQASGLFGIFRHQSIHKLPMTFDVYPKRLPQSSLFSILPENVIHLIGTDPLAQQAFQVKELRAYQSRDSLSAIDWKSSMKRNQWMIKDYDYEEPLPVRLYFLGTSFSQFELLLSLVYSLELYLSSNAKSDLSLIGSFDGQTQKRKQLQDFLTIQASNDLDDLTVLLGHLNHRKQTTIIVTPNQASISSLSISSPHTFVLDEHYLTLLKGGHPT